jgi:hypothetical protein
MRTSLNLAVAAGQIDEIRVEGDRTLVVTGWAIDLQTFTDTLRLSIDGQPRAVTHAFRVPRPDVTAPTTDGATFAGAVVEWVLPDTAAALRLMADGRELFTHQLPAGGPPAYEALRTSTDIFHREHIYASGPPVHEVHADTLELAAALPGPILDFGCGGGALVRALRREGLAVTGIELDRPQIHDYLLPEVAPFVTLYDGSFPAPFPDQAFESVTCCEVLEHIPDPEQAVAELARLARRHVFITVPDMSAIPRGFRHGVIPWHLLEATHVNFFTQHSLVALLQPYASHVEVSRVGAAQCGDYRFHTSLAVRATLKPRVG